MIPGRRKAGVNEEEQNELQKFLSYPGYDGFILSVILLNCVALCLTNPRKEDDEQDYYLIAMSFVFDVIYVVDVSVMLFAFGPNTYFTKQLFLYILIGCFFTFCQLYVVKNVK